MRQIVLIALCVLASAADAPWDRLPSDFAGEVALLATAETTLATRPKDQGALADAICALVTITSDRGAGDEGAWPLRRRARDYAQRRAEARGHPARDLAECWPELWCRACLGDTAAVATEIARLDASGTQPLAVALTLAVTRDHRPYAGRPRPAGLLGVVLAQALLATDGDDPDTQPLLDPRFPSGGARLALALCRHPVLARSAPALRTELASDYGVADAGLEAAVARRGALPPRTLSTIVRWCRTVADAPKQAPGAVLATELAHWLEYRCLSDICSNIDYDADFQDLKRDDPLVGARMIRNFLEGNRVGDLPDLAERAVERGTDLDTTARASLIHHFTRLSEPWNPRGPRQLCRAIARYRAEAEAEADRDPREIEALSRTAIWLGQTRTLRADFNAAAARDPWSAQLALAAALANEAIAAPQRDADAQWTAPGVDAPDAVGRLNAGGAPVLVEWAGSIQVDAEDEFSLGVACSGATDLTLDGSSVVLGAGGVNGERMVTVRLAAGLHPLRLLVAFGGQPPQATVRWRRGDVEPGPLPAAALRDATGATGLGVRAWRLRDDEVAGCQPDHEAPLAALRRIPFWPRAARRFALACEATGWRKAMMDALRIGVAAPPSYMSRIVAEDLFHWLGQVDHPDADQRRELYRCYALRGSVGFIGDADYLLFLLGRHDEWKLLHDMMTDWRQREHDPVALTIAAFTFWHVGRFTDALAVLDVALLERRWPRRHNDLRLRTLPLMRMYGYEMPTADVLRAELTHYQATPSQLNCLDFILNERSRDEALAKAVDLKDGEEVLLYTALIALAHGEHEAAQADLRTLVAAHPDWTEAKDAQALLAWYEHQTAESLSALPKDPTVRRVAVVPIPKREVPVEAPPVDVPPPAPEPPEPQPPSNF